MKKLMGLLLIAALLTGLLVGCAGTPAGNNGTSTPESTPAPTESSTPEANDEAEEAAWPKTIVDAAGVEVTIEKQPERLALLHFSDLEAFYALGVTPVAVANAERIIHNSSVLAPLRNAGIVELGAPTAPSLEKLIEAEPDLIIIFSTHRELRDELEKIAPVFDAHPLSTFTKAERLRDRAKIIGKEEEAEKIIAGWHTKLTEARKQLASFDETVIVLEGWADGKTGWVSGRASTAFFIEDEGEGLGLKAPENLPEVQTQISIEGLADLNPDHIFLRGGFASADQDPQDIYNQTINELSKSTVWNSLTAVKNGQVYRLEESLFSAGAFGMPLFADYAVEMLLQ